MICRVVISVFIVLLPVIFLTPAPGQDQSSHEWNISATASALVEWITGQIISDHLDISARVLSVRDDGCFIDAGSASGVSVGQVYEIYRSPHNGGTDEIAGEVQIAWTRDDYSFAEPRGGLDISEVTTFHFARLIHIPHALGLIPRSVGTNEHEMDRLLQAVHAILSIRGSIHPIHGIPYEPAWKLTVTPDSEGLIIEASLSDPGGEIVGSILLDPVTGDRPPAQTMLDPSYLTGAATPFENYIAPPGRRTVKIASGNIVPGSADELAILDGSDLWIYDLSGTEPRLINSLTVSIPPGPVRHREDTGSLELVDPDGNGQMEICIAPPGASRGEIWKLSGDDWILLEYLPYPARAADLHTGGIIIAPWLIDSPALDPSHLQWIFPTAEREPIQINTGFPPVDIIPIPGSQSALPGLLALDNEGTLHLIPYRVQPGTLEGGWGNCMEVVMYSGDPIVLLTSPEFIDDKLTLLDLYSGSILAEFPIANGPIIDITFGDIDRDGKAEILVAVLEEEGVKIYY